MGNFIFIYSFFRRAPRVFCAVVLRGDLGCPFARQHRDIIRTDDF